MSFWTRRFAYSDVEAKLPQPPHGTQVMRMHTVVCWSTLCVTMLVAASTASAQHYQPFGDLEMHYDMQLFSPPIIDEYGDEPVAPNYGWFADYNRAYVRLTRPDNVATHFQEDGTWGNIWNLGYMTEDNHGWLVSILHFNKTSVTELTAVTDIQDNVFQLRSNVNVGSYAGVELNKTFRVHVGEHGTFFEPFGGFRYGHFQEDLNTETLVVDDPLNPIVEVGTGTAGVFHNTMYGGQIGIRGYNRKGHWIISGELRGFGQMNYQEMSVRRTQITVVDNLDGTFNVGNPIITRNAQDFDEFVVGGELRLEAAYEITREIRVNVGLEVMHLGRGIGRGVNEDSLSAAFINDQAVTYSGIYFGLQMNR